MSIEEAIAAVAPGQIKMATMQGRLPTGRPFRIEVPADLTDAECLAFGRFVLGVSERLRLERGPRIVVPS